MMNNASATRTIRKIAVFGVLVMLIALIASTGCRKKTPQILNDSKIKACSSFEGGKLSAKWTDCPDKVQREVHCATFVNDLKCDCLEDGAQKWFFTATNPPLQTREDATRVANANCHWGLE